MEKISSSKHTSAAAVVVVVFFNGSPKTNTLLMVPVDYTLSKQLNLVFPVDFGNRSFRSSAHSLLGVNVPNGNFRSTERMF